MKDEKSDEKESKIISSLAEIDIKTLIEEKQDEKEEKLISSLA